MRSLGATVLFTAVVLAGCAESQLAGHFLYMTPYQFEKIPCPELKQKAAAASTRVKDIERLRDKASASTAGPVVNTMVYGPDYSRARWEQRLYEEEYARKNCDAPPPPPPPQQLDPIH